VTQAALTVSDQVVGWLKNTFADWINSHQSTSSQDAVPNRGDAISVPLLAANQTRVGPRKPIGYAGTKFAGQRNLHSIALPIFIT
jgi:hypothetical protein